MTIFDKRGVAQKVADSLKSDYELYSTVEAVLEICEMNTNSLKNIVRYLKEIKLRENCEYEDIMKSIKFQEVAQNAQLSERSKGEEISTRLYNLRHPLWSAKQHEFKKLSNKFRALTGGEVIFPEFAEGNTFRISFEIKKEEDIEKIFETISKGKAILSESLKKIKE